MTSRKQNMNSLKRLGLFSFIATLLLLGACKRPESDFGSELLPDGDLLGATQTDTITIIPTVIADDSVRTSNLSSAMLGKFTDPVIGNTIQASIYTQFRLSTTAPTFPADAVVDSVILSLKYTGDYYGKQNIQSFGVFELTESLFIDSVYYSNHRKSTGFQNRIKPGFESYNMRPQDIVLVGTDSVLPQLRLKLDESLGYQLIQAPSSALASNDDFLEFFKGLYIKPSNSNNGGIFNFDLIDAESKLAVFYHYNDDSGNLVETRYDYQINSECSYFSEMVHSRAGTALQPLDTGGEISGDILSYVQAGGGMRTKIDLPFIQDFNNFENRSINRVQLILPFDDDNRFEAQGSLFLVYKDDEGEFRLLPDQAFGTISGTGDFTSDHYIFNISLYIQRLLNGEINSQGLYLVSRNSGVSVNRSILHGPNYSTEDSGENMRMILTFSY
jgi:hypothetical protein